MDFVVDKVSEDSFYMNILMGLPKELNKYKKLGVTNWELCRKPAVSHSEICIWEQKQNILLPENLRNFYNSCNDATTDVLGRLQINDLENLSQITEYEFKNDSGVKTTLERYELRLGIASRMFELQHIGNNNKVVLVYLNSRYSPTIWVTTGAKKFYFLADDFTTYFRMSLAHLGIPNWQLLFTPMGVPQWTENMIRFLAPHLLKADQSVEYRRKQRGMELTQEQADMSLNQLNNAIFQCLPKLQNNLQCMVEKTAQSKTKGTNNVKESHLTQTRDKHSTISKLQTRKTVPAVVI